METKILDDTQHWIIYFTFTVCAIFLVACIWTCVVHILAVFHFPRTPYRRASTYAATLFTTVCATAVFWFLFRSMFLRFHAVAVGLDRIELIFFWPRPHLIVESSNLKPAHIHYYRRKGCRLEVVTGQRSYKSVDLDEIDVAEQVRDEIASVVKR
jgi:hypothetical protein